MRRAHRRARGSGSPPGRCCSPTAAVRAGSRRRLAACRRQLTVESVRSHQGRLLVVFEGVARPRRRRGAARRAALRGQRRRRRRRTDPDEFHDHQLVGLRRGRRRTASGSARWSAIDHAPASDLLVLRRPDGADRAGPVRQGDRPRGRPAPAGGSSSTRPTACSTSDGSPHARRHRHDLPGVLRPAGPVADRQGPRRPALLELAVHDLRTWTHDVHRTVDDTPVRRRARHGDAARAVGRGARRAAPADGAAPRSVPRPAGVPFTQADGARAGRPSRT